MTYLVNEIFHSIQGEGVNTGRSAIFIRFSRCNLWTGREEDRATAICTFCDTDFLRGERLGLYDLVDQIDDVPNAPMVVFTGGEPTLQLDTQLIKTLRLRGHYLAIETNGTRSLPDGLDWVCVSPKADTEIVVTHGNELKLVYPQMEAPPERFEGWAFDHFWLSPMDGPDLKANTAAAVEYVLAHPQWRLNIQTHKAIGVR